jgi:hypothetical protein
MKAISVRDLEKGAKLKCELINNDTWEERDALLTFDWMDWRYWKFVDEDLTIYPYWGRLIKEWDYYTVEHS